MGRNKLPEKTFAWTHELAYAIGLIVTDGCLSRDGRHVILTSKDTDQLETFKKCVGTNCKIGKSKNGNGGICFKVQFGDIQFYKWLNTIGLFSGKTHTIKDIAVPKEYFVDFLRGHLDGDGSITTYLDKYNTFKSPEYIYERLFVRLISASKEHMLWLQEKTTEHLNVKGKLHTAKPSRIGYVPLYILKFGKKESIRLLNQIYYSNKIPYLKRKRVIFDNFLKNAKT